jgi:hypothetical protein
MATMRAHSGLPTDLLALAVAGIGKDWCALRSAIVNNHREHAGVQVALDVIRLAKILKLGACSRLSSQSGLTQLIVAYKRKPMTAVKTWKRHGPKIAPRLTIVYPRIEVLHRRGPSPAELYPDVVDACEEEGGVPSRLIKTDAGVGRQEGTPCQMFAGSPLGRMLRVASRLMISLGRARAG